MKSSNSQERIKELMGIYGITLSELARRTGLPKSTLSYYINGNSIPRQEQLSIIADAFGVNPAWLMGYDVDFEYVVPADDSPTKDELKFLMAYRRTDQQTKDMISRLLAYSEGIEKIMKGGETE